jgi:hypothetical protein
MSDDVKREVLEGEPLGVRGCDLWTFRGDEIARNDSLWKIVEP